MNPTETDAKIASNLVAMASETGLPVPFSQVDIDDLMKSDLSEMEKVNQLRKIKSAVHEVLYAPPRK